MGLTNRKVADTSFQPTSPSPPIDPEKQLGYDGDGHAPAGNVQLMLDPHTRLHRDLKARQVSMIAIGGAIGTGLIIGTGAALAKAGPASILISYSIVGFIVYMVMCALGEMATWLPLESGFTGYAARFCDPALGFSLGYTYWFKYIIVTPNQLTAAALVIQYWVPREKVNPGVFIAVFLVAIIAINYLGVRFFGELEFWLSSIKVLTIVGLIILSLILMLGGGPDHDRKGFRYWKHPGAFKPLYGSEFSKPRSAYVKYLQPNSRCQRQLSRSLVNLCHRNLCLPGYRTRRRHRWRSPKPPQSHSTRHQTNLLAYRNFLHLVRFAHRNPGPIQLEAASFR